MPDMPEKAGETEAARAAQVRALLEDTLGERLYCRKRPGCELEMARQSLADAREEAAGVPQKYHRFRCVGCDRAPGNITGEGSDTRVFATSLELLTHAIEHRDVFNQAVPENALAAVALQAAADAGWEGP